MASDVIIPGLESIEWTRAREEPEGCASLALISAQIGVAWKWHLRIQVKFREALRTWSLLPSPLWLGSPPLPSPLLTFPSSRHRLDLECPHRTRKKRRQTSSLIETPY